MLTVEPAKLEELGAFVDARGNAFCVDCVERGRCGPRLAWCPLGSLGDPAECDGCSRPVVECAPRVIVGTALVEHVKCKVF